MYLSTSAVTERRISVNVQIIRRLERKLLMVGV